MSVRGCRLRSWSSRPPSGSGRTGVCQGGPSITARLPCTHNGSTAGSSSPSSTGSGGAGWPSSRCPSALPPARSDTSAGWSARTVARVSATPAAVLVVPTPPLPARKAITRGSGRRSRARATSCRSRSIVAAAPGFSRPNVTARTIRRAAAAGRRLTGATICASGCRYSVLGAAICTRLPIGRLSVLSMPSAPAGSGTSGRPYVVGTNARPVATPATWSGGAGNPAAPGTPTGPGGVGAPTGPGGGGIAAEPGGAGTAIDSARLAGPPPTVSSRATPRAVPAPGTAPGRSPLATGGALATGRALSAGGALAGRIGGAGSRPSARGSMPIRASSPALS